MVNNFDIKNYLAEQTIKLSKQEIIAGYQKHVQTIQQLYQDYNYLKKESQAVEITLRKITSVNDSIEKGLSLIYSDAIKLNKDYQAARTYLDSLQSWSIRAYSEIVQFRSFITGGQQLVYHVLDKGGKSYFINEDEYLKLLSSELSRGYSQHMSHIKPGELNKILNLKINNPTELTKPLLPPINIHQDKVYLFLKEEAENILNETSQDGLTESRLYELYDQTKASLYPWAKFNQPIKRLGEKRKYEIKNFAKNYISAKMHKDRVAFYKMGDAVLNNSVIIENKIGGSAMISLSTIINAISSLNKILNSSNLTEASLSKKLKDFYVKVGSSDIEQQIQKGAGEAAEKGIDNTIKQIIKMI